MTPSKRLASYLDEDVDDFPRPSAAREDGDAGPVGSKRFPSSILSVFSGALASSGRSAGGGNPAGSDLSLFNLSSSQNKSSSSSGGGAAHNRHTASATAAAVATIDIKRLCNYLIDSYEPEISGDFLCGCCCLWSPLGNFDVFFEDDDAFDENNLFNLQHARKENKKESVRGGQTEDEQEAVRRRQEAEKSAVVLLRSSQLQQSQKSKASVILQDTLVKFFYPFHISIKETSVLGKTYFRNKFRPLDTTDQLFKFVINNFFLAFRKSFSAEKAPSDVRIYKCTTEGIKTMEIEKPSKDNVPAVLLADICGDEDCICVESASASQLCEQLEKKQRGKEQGREQGLVQDGQGEAENRHPPPSNAKELVERLARPPVLHVRAAQPFPYPYGSVHAWGIATMVKYVQQVLELPQYEEHFLQYELNGYSFICLDKATAARVCAATDYRTDTHGQGQGQGQVALHTAKLAYHAGKALDSVP